MSAGMIDAHPALIAASPQAPVTDWFLATICSTTARFFSRTLQLLYELQAAPGGPAPPQPTASFAWGTPDGYDFYLRMGPLANSNTKYLKGANPFWNINSTTPTTTTSGRRGPSGSTSRPSSRPC